MEIFFLFILGLVVGSFLNVVVFRIEKGESFVLGRSHCQNCDHSLAWFENLPLLSFLFLRGKCRKCALKISWQYPLVELGTAILFALSYFIFSFYDSNNFLIPLLFLGVLSFAILIFVYDSRFLLIPNSFLWGINISTALFLSAHWIWSFVPVQYFPPSPTSAFLGAVISGIFFFFLVYLSKETWMGWGDVWLGVWGGMLLGMELVQLFITGAFTFGAIVGLTLILRKKKTLKTEVPFAPYLLLSGFFFLTACYFFPSILPFLSPWLPGTIE